MLCSPALQLYLALSRLASEGAVCHCKKRAGTKDWHHYSSLLQPVKTQCLMSISRGTYIINTYTTILIHYTNLQLKHQSLSLLLLLLLLSMLLTLLASSANA